jgi:tape measure domain-containing protein
MPNKVAYTFVAADKFSGVARRVSKRTDELSKKMSEFRTEAAEASGAVNRLVGGIRKAGLGLIATGAALGAAQIPFLMQFAELEKIQVAFEQIVGSAEKGRAVFKDLQEFQRGTPFDLVSIKTAAQTLLTFGTGTEDLRIELTALGNIAAASGSRIEDLATVFGKAQTAGRVTQDVINSLALRGVNVMEVWSRKTGVAVDKLRKVVSKGQIPFEVLRETILDLAGREGGRFFGIMTEQSKRLAGAWTRLGGATTLFKAKLGGLLSKIGEVPRFLNFMER